MEDNLFQFKPMPNWIQLFKKDFERFGVADNARSKVVKCYRIGGPKEIFKTVTLYFYGKYDGQIQEMEEDYPELQKDIKMQEEYGFFPLHWEKVEGDKFLAVLKPVSAPVTTMVDLYFIYDNNFYSFHTNIKKDEKDLSFDSLCRNYDFINYVFKSI